jgi:hypothetical protein
MAKSEFKEAETLRDPDGLILVITEKVGAGTYSFSLQKEYEKDGQILRASFMNRRHIPAARRLLAQVEEWFDQEADRAASRKAAAARGTVSR